MMQSVKVPYEECKEVLRQSESTCGLLPVGPGVSRSPKMELRIADGGGSAGGGAQRAQR
jgi:hypothetical protein